MPGRSAVFALRPGTQVHGQLCADELINNDDDECLVRRVVTAEGRSRAFINNVPITLQYMKSVAEQLVDIQDQHQHQRLSDKHVQRTVFDEYAGLKAQAEKVQTLHRLWQQSVQEIAALTTEISAQDDRKHLISYQLQEFDEAQLVDGELSQLEQEQKRLAQAQTILTTLTQVQSHLEELDNLRHSARLLADIDDTHSDLTAGLETLTSAVSLLDDAARDLRRYQDQVVVDPESLSTVEARLVQLTDLARKHKVAPEQLNAHAQALQDEFASLNSSSEQLDQLVVEEAKQSAEFQQHAQQLSKARRKASANFSRDVDQYITALGIKEGSISVVFHEQVSEHGLEQVEFYVCTNKQFAPGPLTKIASGGEQTRISLALQIVAAANSALPCLILDEADVGVGGTTADTVGRILRQLGVHTQVLCVTHAPQVAALGNQHMRVVKRGSETAIEPLAENDRVSELARMLAGADVTDKSLAYAQTLLDEANA